MKKHGSKSKSKILLNHNYFIHNLGNTNDFISPLRNADPKGPTEYLQVLLKFQ